MPATKPTEKNATAEGDEGAGSKHEISDKPSPEPKRSKKSDAKTQQTIEDTMPSPTEAYGNGHTTPESKEMSGTDKNESHEARGRGRKTSAANEDSAHRDAVPSSILEKGIIYFFFRGRVGIDEPSNVGEIRRSYMVLRPLRKDSKIEQGTVQDAGNVRLIAVPKKVFPRTGKERWIAFVEKTHESLDALKEDFISSSDYETKTVGTRHTPAAKPAAEGIYAITTTGRESHLAYMITLPSELGDVQTRLGLREKGSFIISTRNPQYEAPRGTGLPKGPDYPKDVQDEFRALRWAPSQPHHLDHVNTQFLLVGESSGIAKATEPPEDGGGEGGEDPEAELEKWEDEDTQRMEGVREEGDDDDDGGEGVTAAIFADLGVFAKDYAELGTTF